MVISAIVSWNEAIWLLINIAMDVLGFVKEMLQGVYDSLCLTCSSNSGVQITR